MNLDAYFSVFIQFVIALGLGAGILLASRLFGQKGDVNPIKDRAYECGLIPASDSVGRFPVKFYLVAMLFILFDIEVVFMVPWALVYRNFLAEGIPIFMPGFIFFTILVVGLLYELKKGALEWE